MARNRLELALEKTESVVLTQRRKWNTMSINFSGHTFSSKKSVKYLGIQVDLRLHFADHSEAVAKKASVACNKLSHLLPKPKRTTARIQTTTGIRRHVAATSLTALRFGTQR